MGESSPLFFDNMNANTIVSIIVGVILISTILVPFITITNDDNELDVLIITGQSNAGYRESKNYRVDPEVATELLSESGSLYYYGTSTSPATYEIIGSPTYDSTWESYSIQPMCKDGKYVIGGLEAPIGIGIHNRTNNDVLVLNVAVSSATISWLDPDGVWGTFAYGLITHALDLVEDRYDSINKLGWACLQGESNSSTDVDVYKTDFMSMANFFADLGFKNGYIVPPMDSLGGNSIIAQYELAETYDYLKIVTSVQNTFTTENGLLYGDKIHYTERGRIIIGEKIVDAIDYPNSFDYSSIRVILNILPILATILLIVGIGYEFKVKRS